MSDEKIDAFIELSELRDKMEHYLDTMNAEIMILRDRLKSENKLKSFKISYHTYSGYNDSDIVQGVTEDDAQTLWLERLEPELNEDLSSWGIDEIEPEKTTV